MMSDTKHTDIYINVCFFSSHSLFSFFLNNFYSYFLSSDKKLSILILFNAFNASLFKSLH